MTGGGSRSNHLGYRDGLFNGNCCGCGFAATGSAGTGVDVDATAICPDAGAATDGSTGTGVGSDVTTEAGVGVRTDWEHETIPIPSMARVAMARLYLMAAPYGGLPKCNNYKPFVIGSAGPLEIRIDNGNLYAKPPTNRAGLSGPPLDVLAPPRPVPGKLRLCPGFLP